MPDDHLVGKTMLIASSAESLTASLRAVPIVPASFFGIVLGLAGLGNTWRIAHRVWALPSGVGEALHIGAAGVWLVLMVLYLTKWIRAREAAVSELEHPVQCCFVGLIGVATMLIAGGTLPYSRLVAGILFFTGVVFTLVFAIWRTGALWQGGRDPAATTAVLYLPTVAGSFVAAQVAAAFGHVDWAQLAFGSGFFSWLAIESVLLHRLYTAPALASTLRPTLGIQLAPPTVGGMAYLSVTDGPPDVLAHAMLGYGLLQVLLLLRLLPWIRQQPFAASYWAFTFGLSALAAMPLRMIERGDGGAAAVLAPYLFSVGNVAIGAIALGTLWLVFQGRLVAGARPKPSPA